MAQHPLLELGNATVDRVAKDTKFSRVRRRENVFWRRLSREACYWLGTQIHMRHDALELVPTLGLHVPRIARLTSAFTDNKEAAHAPVLHRKMMALDPARPFVYQARSAAELEVLVRRVFGVIEQSGVPYYSAFQSSCSVVRALREGGPGTGILEQRLTRLPAALFACEDYDGAAHALGDLRTMVEEHRRKTGGDNNTYAEYYGAFIRRAEDALGKRKIPESVRRQIRKDERVMLSLLAT